MPLYRAEVTITILGPLLTKSSTPGAYGVDSVCARDADGRFILPWTMVKGRIRDAWRELYGLTPPPVLPDPAAILGPEVDGEGGNRSKPEGNFSRYNARLFGTDFVLKLDHEKRLRAVVSESEHKLFETRTRISQDPFRHAAAEDMLQVMESPFQAGESYDFEGAIEYEAANDGERDDIKRAIVKSLHWAGALGSQTSVGFGRIGSIDCRAHPKLAKVITDTEPAGAGMWLRLRTNQPLCITQKRSQENLFVGGAAIPGAVLKGAMAAQWSRMLGKDRAEIAPTDDASRADLAAVFDRIRFSHARPVAQGAAATPVAIPLSLAKVGAEYRDMSGFDAPPDDLPEPPEFQPDWKDRTVVNERYGWPKIKTELRVRTAIDPTCRRAKTGNLFAYETVLSEGLEWYCQVGFPKIETSALAMVRAQFLDVLQSGLHGVGKTKATLSVELVAAPPRKVASLPGPQAGEYIVTLQTPALLVPPEALCASRDPEQLREAYGAVFAAWTGGALELIRLFASQTLHGGIYLYHRFQEMNRYRPYALTDEGSVFVFRIKQGWEAQAASKVAAWERDGFPTPPWAVEAFSRDGLDGSHWSNNPYVPENGFGEVAVNLENPFQGG
jgi:CRISPR/Cas system CSM-associated protein Csm3 (group 7 of RAMP superfamily)